MVNRLRHKDKPAFRKKLLYICANDGTDTRIAKELKTLSTRYHIHFFGIGETIGPACQFYCKHVTLVSGTHRSLWTLMKFGIKLGLWLVANRNITVHVVDEQFYCVFLPLLFKRHVVLDVFDSYFLKLNKPKEDLWLLKKVVYGLPVAIIVTDENRRKLLPDWVTKKSFVIPNVPFRMHFSSQKPNKPHHLTLCYFGTLTRHRGSEFVHQLVCSSSAVEVHCAGWVKDEFTEKLISHPRVHFHGVITQTDANRMLHNIGDYLVAIYPDDNLNNINASPNKLYDAMHAQKPLIINNSCRVAAFVADHNLGVVVDLNRIENFRRFAAELLSRRDEFNVDQSLLEEYCWEHFEQSLINLHSQLLG